MPLYEPVKGSVEDFPRGDGASGGDGLRRKLKYGVVGGVLVTLMVLLISATSADQATLGSHHKAPPAPTMEPTAINALGFCCFYGGCDDCKAKAGGFCGSSPESCSTCTGEYCSVPTAVPTIFVPAPTADPVAPPTVPASAPAADDAPVPPAPTATTET